ncbi:hypothetical protein B0T19DRAFT_404100 [Cercophora scortea]|uniref:Uncharacterized protein n=1 Tax=Cercophora scortea TaxID=314031 RepID=A0AAE0I6P0_9PEZI|nr:hypothetical protein B0T19DRAFT_404100 [Cercophora scortea]
MATTDKASKKGSAGKDAAQGPDRLFTPREQELVVYGIMCMTDLPVPDYTKLAARMGMSNVRSASNAWNNLRKKITDISKNNNNNNGDDAEVKDENTSGPTPATTPAKGKPGRKRKAPATETPEDSADDADANTVVTTPAAAPAAKRGRGRPRKTNPALSSPSEATPAAPKAVVIKKEADVAEEAGFDLDLEDMKPNVIAGRKKLVGAAPVRRAGAASKKAEPVAQVAAEGSPEAEIMIKKEPGLDGDAEAGQIYGQEAETQAEAKMEVDEAAQKADAE